MKKKIWFCQLDMKHKVIIFLLLFLTVKIAAQGIDINDYLKKIENGNIKDVKERLTELKIKYPNDPSVLFLEGVLTENGKTSVVLFSNVVNNYPKSRYADAAAFRIYSYYYALEMSPEAATWLSRLKKDYPSSPYIKIAEKNIPPLTNTQKIKYRFTIQAGAFSNKDNANAMKKQFIDAGFSSEIKEKTVAGTIFQVVYVGKFATEEEAKNFLKQINSEYSLDGRVISIN
jgi:hypothetical protein